MGGGSSIKSISRGSTALSCAGQPRGRLPTDCHHIIRAPRATPDRPCTRREARWTEARGGRAGGGALCMQYKVMACLLGRKWKANNCHILSRIFLHLPPGEPLLP